MKDNSRTICFLTSGLGSVVMIYARGQRLVKKPLPCLVTLRANTVLPPLRTHLLTAPPAPSPKLPSSTILPSLAATFQPASSRSSTSSGLPFSRLNFSRSGNSAPCALPSRSVAVQPGPPADDDEYSEPTAEWGSCDALGWPIKSAKSTLWYEEAVVEVE